MVVVRGGKLGYLRVNLKVPPYHYYLARQYSVDNVANIV